MALPTLPPPDMVHVDAQGYSTHCCTAESMQQYALAALRAQPAKPEKFHRQASHVSPDYRDGWNAAIDAMPLPPPPGQNQAQPEDNDKFGSRGFVDFPLPVKVVMNEHWMEAIEKLGVVQQIKGETVHVADDGTVTPWGLSGAPNDVASMDAARKAMEGKSFVKTAQPDHSELVKRYLAFDIGCLECGESSSVVGVFATKKEAEEANIKAAAEQKATWTGEHSFEVFELPPAIGETME